MVKQIYQETLRKILVGHNIRRIDFAKDKYFGVHIRYIEVTQPCKEYPQGHLHVALVGLHTPLNNAYFDFTVDYAALIYHIEQDLYAIQHKITPKHGLEITFS
jgi:hypothetical protein